MRSDRERDAGMDRLLREALGSQPARAAGACPAPDELAAYAERSLPDGERASLDSHLADCSRCQDTLAMLATMAEAPAAAAGPDAARSASWWRAGWKRWLVPLGAVATAAVLYVAVKPDTTLAPVPSRDSIVASAPAQLPATPGTLPDWRSAKADDQSRREDASLPPDPAALQGATLQTKTAAGKAQGTDERVGVRARVAQAPPPAEVPPALLQNPPAPVPTLVHSERAAPPPPPPAPPAGTARVEVKGEMAQALPLVSPRAAGADQTKGEAQRFTGTVATRKVTISGEAAGSQHPLEIITLRAAGSDNVLWQLLGRQILRSEDAGKTWQQQHSAPGPLLAGSAPSPTTCWTVGAAGLVLRTTDGRAWEPRPFPEAVPLDAVIATDAAHATVTTRDGRRFSTEDGGATWTLVR